MLNRYNDLNDPLMGRSVCISGQLQLLELTNHLLAECPSLKVIQLNTDGIMVSLDNTDEPKYQEITAEWEKRTGFELEEDFIKTIIQKDVNGYVEIAMDGSQKIKGGYLVRGIAAAGAFNVNNNMVIVAEALKQYLAEGILPEETIGNCDELLKFQIVAKASGKYSAVYHMVKDERVKVQKCNRVYATSDPRYGTLIKVHKERGNDAKIAGLPEHCLIDNRNELCITDIDKQFYIDLCWKQIQDFLGYDPRVEGEIDMASSAKPMNVYQKLLKARVRFQENGIFKSGKNMHMQYTYFELDDIVPVITPIFDDLGLLPVVSYDNEMAMMQIINADNPEELIVFSSPMREIEAIKNRSGDAVTNSLQRLGAVQTYERRYLYMAALDIVEMDAIERDAGAAPVEQKTAPAVEVKKADPKPAATKATEKKEPAPIKRTAPVTAEKREEIKKELTNPEGKASELQITQLKTTLSSVLKKKPEMSKAVQNVMVTTNALTEVTAEECEKLLKKFSALLEG